ncbi:MAG: hypothetical protein AAF561_12110 [Planctomycetota bacterium]
MTSLRPTDLQLQLDDDQLKELMTTTEGTGPCLSLYMPTHRKGPDTRENSIRYKALLKKARESVDVVDGRDEVHGRIESLETIADDEPFWQHQIGGMALFSNRESTRIYRVTQKLPERVAVADSFHVKPIIRVLQQAGRYHLLAVTQKSVRLFEGGLEGLDETVLDDEVPTTIVEALGGQVEGELNVSSYGGLSYSGMFHGHHDNKDDRNKDIERYLRAVDRAVYDFHCRGGDLPLYFAGDVDYHDIFFKVSHHPRNTKKGIRINPDAVEVDRERLEQEMEAVFRPDFEKEVHELTEQFGNAKARAGGSDDVDAVAKAAREGRVLSLIVDAGKSIGGRLDPDTGAVKRAKESGADVDDVLDDLCELVMRAGGKVRVVPSDMHPTDTGVAAVYRY